jgi:hypothetical protein
MMTKGPEAIFLYITKSFSEGCSVHSPNFKKEAVTLERIENRTTHMFNLSCRIYFLSFVTESKLEKKWL